MKLSNCSIRAKLMLAFGGLCLMVIAVAAMSLTSLSSANDRFVAYVNGVNAQATLARTFRTAVDRRAIAARNLVLVTKPADLELEKAAVTAAHRDVGELLAKLRTEAAVALGSGASTDPLLQEMEKVERAYEPAALGIAELALHGRQAEAVDRPARRRPARQTSRVAAARWSARWSRP